MFIKRNDWNKVAQVGGDANLVSYMMSSRLKTFVVVWGDGTSRLIDTNLGRPDYAMVKGAVWFMPLTQPNL